MSNETFSKFIPAVLFSLVAAGSLSAQDINFSGSSPSLSLSGVLVEKPDVNILVTTKIRTGQQLFP
jgi:hypothetical protein